MTGVRSVVIEDMKAHSTQHLPCLSCLQGGQTSGCREVVMAPVYTTRTVLSSICQALYGNRRAASALLGPPDDPLDHFHCHHIRCRHDRRGVTSRGVDQTITCFGGIGDRVGIGIEFSNGIERSH